MDAAKTILQVQEPMAGHSIEDHLDIVLNAFTSYGLAGVVIGALFYSNYLLFKSFEKKLTEQSERHMLERKEQSERHANERENLLTSINSFHDDVMQILTEKRDARRQSD